MTIVAAPLDATGAGATATATVDLVSGAITGYTVTNPGSGYTLPPLVVVNGAGIGATATAAIATGVVSSIVVNTPQNFVDPEITITPTTGGTGAAAVASGGVGSITLLNGGSGYSIEPIVVIGQPNLTDPGGAPAVQATALAVMNASGVVTDITISNPGTGYTSAPSITINDGLVPPVSQPPAQPAVAATAESTVRIDEVDVTAGGSGYVGAPTVTILDLYPNPLVPVNPGAVATATVSNGVSLITPVDPGSGYLTPGLEKFVDPLPGLGAPALNKDTSDYIPVAVPETPTAATAGTDFYEIGLVQYRHVYSSQIPATLQRGYVQLSPNNAVTPYPLMNANLVNVENPGDISNTLPDGTVVWGKPILIDGVQAYGIDQPRYLGPTIVANKDKPVRVLFRNLLPNGEAGDLFLPVDTSLMGSGMGPNAVMLDPVTKVPMDMVQDDGTVLDGVRNQMCGETDDPGDSLKPNVCFSENRGTLHLHGGVTPWISDGTPHQWITPAGSETFTDYPKGVSVSNVPDMPDYGPGTQTFFYTNQQSARLMWTHDHSWGITRLNVYAGEAAGYLVKDQADTSLFGQTGTFPELGDGTPLIVQDKTFVSASVAAGETNPTLGTPGYDPAQNTTTDPTWNTAKWGGEGSLWTPHVYMPAQNPGSPTGMSEFGRWMYGPWFWPPAKDVKYPPIANPYYQADCDPNVILSDGSNQFCEPALIPSTPNVSVGMEAFNDTPVVNGKIYPNTTVDPKAYRYRILNAANDRFWNLSWYVADPTTGTLSEVALKQSEVDAAQTDPVVFPTPDTAVSPAGPNWIQIGTEGGFLPAPVVVPAHETTWISDPTRFDVGNVDQHSLLLAPAERADVIVDFSQFAGQTLILYNDAPAAFPARVPGYDYYTGGPDLTPSGAPTTLPGYGPNTRTVMRVTVGVTASRRWRSTGRTPTPTSWASSSRRSDTTQTAAACSNRRRTRSSSVRRPTTRHTVRTSREPVGATARPIRQRSATGSPVSRSRALCPDNRTPSSSSSTRSPAHSWRSRSNRRACTTR